MGNNIEIAAGIINSPQSTGVIDTKLFNCALGWVTAELKDISVADFYQETLTKQQ